MGPMVAPLGSAVSTLKPRMSPQFKSWTRRRRLPDNCTMMELPMLKKSPRNLLIYFTGVPKVLVERLYAWVAQEQANGNVIGLADVYWDCIEDLMQRVRHGEDIMVPAQFTGPKGHRVVFKLSSDEADRFKEFQKRWGRGNRSSLLIAALNLRFGPIMYDA